MFAPSYSTRHRLLRSKMFDEDIRLLEYCQTTARLSESPHQLKKSTNLFIAMMRHRRYKN